MINMKPSVTALLSGALLLAFATVDANAAASVGGKCEYRAQPERSKADAKASGLAPGTMYSISAADGTGVAQVATPGGEVQTSFDSNPNDIAFGDTAISAGSLAGGSVTFTVRNAADTVVATGTANCRMR